MDILQLLPKGKLWSGKNTINFFKAIEDTFKRIFNDSNSILQECFPETSNYLFKDWSRMSRSTTRYGIMAVMRATGGNTEEYYLEIAKKYDEKCFIQKVKKEDLFVSGLSKAGKRLGHLSSMRFNVVFVFPSIESNEELEDMLYKIKPAHIHFEYHFKKPLEIRFITGRSRAGEKLLVLRKNLCIR